MWALSLIGAKGSMGLGRKFALERSPGALESPQVSLWGS